MSGWRDSWNNNWIVKEILSEIPIIGSFVSNGFNAEGIHDALKCISTLGGSTLTMMVIMPSAEDEHNTKIKIAAEYLGIMTIGMTAGKITYKALCSAANEGRTMLHQYCLKRKTNSSTPQPSDAASELEALKTDVHSEPSTESRTAAAAAANV